jgi:hypothetical protein
MGGRVIFPHVHNIGSRWRWMISFIPQPLYSVGSRACLNAVVKRKIAASPWIELRFSGRQARSLVIMLLSIADSVMVLQRNFNSQYPFGCSVFTECPPPSGHYRITSYGSRNYFPRAFLRNKANVSAYIIKGDVLGYVLVGDNSGHSIPH